MRPLLTPEGFAELLAISVKTVHRMIKRREIAVVYMGKKCIRITQSEAERYMSSNTIPASAVLTTPVTRPPMRRRRATRPGAVTPAAPGTP